MNFMNPVRIRLFRFVLLGLLSVPHTACQISFTSQYRGKTVTGLVGSSVNFTWSFTGDVERVYWGLKRYGVNGIESNGILVSLEKRGPVSVLVPSAYIGRVSGRGDVSSGQVIFTLSSIKKSDEGFYGCKITPISPFRSVIFDSVYLAVKEVPQITISSVQARYNEGRTVNTSCTASGRPDPYVIWIRNGLIKSSGKKTAVLTFSSVNRADDGLYTCRANNSVGNDEKHVTLAVYYKPEGTTITTSAAANTVTQGDSVTFTCHVTAAKPQVTQYRFYVNDTLVQTSNDSQYVIYNVPRSQHYCVYKCVPHNDVGDGPEATAALHVNVPAQFTVLPQNVTVKETNPIVVSCDASGFPTPSITWTKYGQVVSQLKQLVFQRSSRIDTGMYVCTASNGVGQDKTACVYVTVQYPPTIRKASTSAAKSWIGQTVILTCVSDGVPTPTLTWYKPDGSEINSVTATQNTVNVKMENDGDFGEYKCGAANRLKPSDYKTVKVQQIRRYNPCFNNSCYVISDAESGKTWPENRRTCQAKGGDLVSIETEGEWQFINGEIQKHYIKEPNEWHIGLKKNDQGNWKWVNGKPLTISKWQTTMGQPSGDGDVVVMSKDYPPTTQGLFNDLDEGLPRAFICEIKAT